MPHPLKSSQNCLSFSVMKEKESPCPCGYEHMTTTITSSGPACVMIVAGQQQQQLYMPSWMNHRPPQPNPCRARTQRPEPCSPIVFFLVRLHYRPTAACSHFATTAAARWRARVVHERAPPQAQSRTAAVLLVLFAYRLFRPSSFARPGWLG